MMFDALCENEHDVIVLRDDSGTYVDAKIKRGRWTGFFRVEGGTWCPRCGANVAVHIDNDSHVVVGRH